MLLNIDLFCALPWGLGVSWVPPQVVGGPPSARFAPERPRRVVGGPGRSYQSGRSPSGRCREAHPLSPHHQRDESFSPPLFPPHQLGASLEWTKCDESHFIPSHSLNPHPCSPLGSVKRTPSHPPTKGMKVSAPPCFHLTS